MSHESHVLRMTVDQNQHIRGRTATDTAHLHRTGRTGRESITHDTPTGNKKSGHLFTQNRQQGSLVPLFYLCPADSGNGEWQVTDICLIAGSRYHHILDDS